MKNIPYKPFILAVSLLAAGLLTWGLLGSNPREVFLGEIEELIEEANEGKHLDLRRKLSAEMESYVTDNYMSVQQALIVARKFDTDSKRRYRFAELLVFEPHDYAEIGVERSGPNGNFSKVRRFTVPFVYRDGEWLVAGSLRDGRDFISPF